MAFGKTAVEDRVELWVPEVALAVESWLLDLFERGLDYGFHWLAMGWYVARLS